MFTGLIQSTGKLKAKQQQTKLARLEFALDDKDFLKEEVLGASIAVNGACLTVVEFTQDHRGFIAEAAAETLALTTLGKLKVGAILNFEKSLTLQQPLGGHLVSGHVDGLAIVQSIKSVGESWDIRLSVPATLSRYVAKKGGVCLDGISLTVNTVSDNKDGAEFSVLVIPHTYAHTNIKTWKVGSEVNLEVDMIARYVERLFSGSVTHPSDKQNTLSTGLNYEKIRAAGFSQSD